LEELITMIRPGTANTEKKTNSIRFDSLSLKLENWFFYNYKMFYRPAVSFMFSVHMLRLNELVAG